ncbi:MAG: transketolase, partial [Clostridia bacterium]|nr:transketolase [Clostridia bacterium]
GMAREGRTVITYSIGNFPTLRCIEQIRNDCAYHDADVKVVCVGGGFVYGSLGMSHHATEDMAIMRALPGVTVFTPGDPEEVEAIVPVMLKTPGTCYLRLGRGGEPTLHDGPVADWQHPRALTLREGADVAILSAGGILTQTLSAAELLAEQGVSAEVVSFPCIKPIDAEKIAELAQRFRHIVTVEEHSVVGGFGSAVAEVLAERGAPCRLHRIGMPDIYSCIVGTQQYLRGAYDMDDQAIARRTLAWLKENA